MQDHNSIFNSWVPKKLIVPFLIIAILPHLMLLSLFNMNSTFSASFLDVEVDDLQFMFCMAYGTIVCSMFYHTRMFHYFNIRSYLLVTTMLNIILLFAMTLTTQPQLVLIMRFMQGPMMFLEGVIIIPIVMYALQTSYAKIIALSSVYTYMMTGDKITLTLVKFAIENYSHNVMIYMVIFFHIIILFGFMLLFNQNRLFPKKPLYQLNLGGGGLLITSLVCGSFFFVYGKKYEWFESPLIIAAFIGMLVAGGLFLLHQKTGKRPLFHYEVFKSERIVLGIIIFFFFYMLRSSMSNLYQVMGSVWKWEWEYVLKIQYFNVAGSVLGSVTACYLLIKKVDNRIMITIGLAILTASLFWFSFLFYPDTTLQAIAPPLFLEGLGQGVVFAPLVFYMIGSVNPNISGSASQSGTTIRFWSSTIGYALMQNLTLYLTTKNQNAMSKNLDVSNPIFQKEWNDLFMKAQASHLSPEAIRMAVGSLKGRLSTQALLVSNVEIFRGLTLVGITVIIALLLYQPIKRKLGFNKV